MDKYIWIFPVLFIFHDMEEVIWLPGFIKNNREDITKRYPIAERLLSAYEEGMTTEAFALPPSIMLLMHTKWDMGISAIAGAIIGIAGVAANLKLAHMLMAWYDRKLKGKGEQ